MNHAFAYFLENSNKKELISGFNVPEIGGYEWYNSQAIVDATHSNHRYLFKEIYMFCN